MAEPATLTRHTFVDSIDTLWANYRFRTFAKFFGFGPVRDSRGVTWPNVRDREEIIKSLEEIFVWGKKKAKSEAIEDVIPKVKERIDNLGTNLTGRELIHKILMDIRWSKISETDGKAETKSEEVDPEAMKDAEEKIEKMKSELKTLKNYEQPN